MQDAILCGYIVLDLLFALTGGLLMVFAFATQAQIGQLSVIGSVGRNLLIEQCPLNAAIGNAVLIFLTFLLSAPAVVMPTTRGWLKVHGYMTVICGLFTMIIGLSIWFSTLQTRSNLSTIWNAQTRTTQSLLQQELKCCGYFNSTSPAFVVDTQCPNAAIAMANSGCVSPFATLANGTLDIVFTGAFGIVGVDVLLILATAMLLKDRKEKERYRHIDEKNGTSAF